MAEGDALSTHIFGLELGGIQVQNAQEVSGLTLEQDVVDVPQTSVTGERIIRKQPGGRKATEVTITRVVDESDAFTKWAQQTALHGDVDGARQNITIEYKKPNSETQRRIHLVNAWAYKWEAPTLNAGSAGAATEKASIAFEDIEVE